MSGVQCKCGLFMANAGFVVATRGLDPYLKSVIGDCSRCGPDSEATREGDGGWAWCWDAWSPEIDQVADQMLAEVVGGLRP
jgi:hypothetical protein